MALISRSVGPSGVGLWAMYMAAGGILAPWLLNWSQSGFIRFGREEWTVHHSFMRTWVARQPLIFLGLAIAGLALLTQPGNFLVAFYHLPRESWREVFAVAVILWLQGETQCIYRITGQFRRQISAQVATDVIVLTYLWFLLRFGAPESPHQLIVGLIIVLGSCWVVIWILALLQSRSATHFDGQDFQSLRSKLVSYCWPIIPGMIFVYISNWGNHMLISAFHTSAEVGYFDAGFQVTIGFFSIASPLSILYLPHLIDMKLRDENAEVIFFNRTAPVLVALWITGTVFSLILLPWLFLLVFGPQYVNASAILLVLCASIPGAAILALYAIRYELNNRLGRGTIYSGVMIAVNFLVAWLLVPDFGGVGAAIGISCSNILLQFIYLIDFHGFSKIWRTKIFVIFSCATVFGIIQAMVGDDPLARLVLGASSILLFGVVSYLIGIFDNGVLKELLPRFILKEK